MATCPIQLFNIKNKSEIKVSITIIYTRSRCFNIWFELKKWERDEDFTFYEYCTVTPKYSAVLSVIWEEVNLDVGFDLR